MYLGQLLLASYFEHIRVVMYIATCASEIVSQQWHEDLLLTDYDGEIVYLHRLEIS